MTRSAIVAAVLAVACGATAAAQESKPMSPTATAVAHVRGKWVKPARGPQTLGGQDYEGGQRIEITYGAPLKRGRDLFGAGENYGKATLVGAPIWRAGANVSTRLKTELPLIISGKRVAPGEYSLFIDLKENNWTLVVSSYRAQAKYDPADKDALWGSYGYKPDKDVLRTPMKLDTLPHNREQLLWEFLDMTDAGGTLAISWGKQMASVPFVIGN